MAHPCAYEDIGLRQKTKTITRAAWYQGSVCGGFNFCRYVEIRLPYKDLKQPNMKKIIVLLVIAVGFLPPTQAGLMYVVNPFSMATTPAPRALGDMPELPAASLRLRASAAGIFPVHTAAKAQKLGFWNRLTLRIAPKKYRTQLYLAMQDTEDADKKAKDSRIIGFIALACAIVPYTLIVAVPLGIIAIAKGSKARKMGSTKRTGNSLGIIALCLVGTWLIVGAIYVFSTATWFFFGG
jgi:hypothetical protein